MYNRYIKRWLDIFLGITLLLIALIPMGVIALLIKCTDPKGSVIFRQTRVGRDGKNFRILKFRTMRSDAPHHIPSNEMSQEDYDRYVTKIGKHLRSTSLDELPQFINIINGEMSFVGPRPVVLKEHTLLNAREEAGLASFRPGLTGWAQINGRNILTDSEKAAYDAEYKERISFFFDMYCLLKTLWIAVTKKGFLAGTNDRIDANADFEDTGGSESCSTGRPEPLDDSSQAANRRQ